MVETNLPGWGNGSRQRYTHAVMNEEGDYMLAAAEKKCEKPEPSLSPRLKQRFSSSTSWTQVVSRNDVAFPRSSTQDGLMIDEMRYYIFRISRLRPRASLTTSTSPGSYSALATHAPGERQNFTRSTPIHRTRSQKQAAQD